MLQSTHSVTWEPLNTKTPAMTHPFGTNLPPLVGYTEAAYNDESLYWRALRADELELWDWKHAHRTPPRMYFVYFDQIRAHYSQLSNRPTSTSPPRFRVTIDIVLGTIRVASKYL